MTLSRCARARTLRRGRVALLLLAWIGAGSTDARADWLLTPYIGTTFATETAYLQLDVNAATSKHTIYGGSGAWLTEGILGLEADLAFVPGFFEQDDFNLVIASSVTTLFGNVIAAVPLSITRESLRPYLVAGLGLVSVHLEDAIRLEEPDESLGLQLGAGAFGFISDRIGLRFDLRQTRTLTRTTTILAERETALRFWRATIGAAIRF